MNSSKGGFSPGRNYSEKYKLAVTEEWIRGWDSCYFAAQVDEQPSEPAAQYRFPRNPDPKSGWTIDPEFIHNLDNSIKARPDPWDVGMEGVEEVLLALERLSEAKVTERSARRGVETGREMAGSGNGQPPTKVASLTYAIGDSVVCTWPRSRKDAAKVKSLPFPGGHLYVIGWPDGGELCIEAEHLTLCTAENGGAGK